MFRSKRSPVATALGLAAWLLLAASLACGSDSDTRPSVVLIVIDTLRASAVSAYGVEQGTTPNIDALAARGHRFSRALATAPWTLPSHASLLTGVGVDRHRVGTPGQLSLDEELVTLAERFSAAGYETAAFSENMLVSDVFHQLQGFRWKRVTRVFRKGEGVPLDVHWQLHLETRLAEWLAQRDPEQPFFLFINLFDAHSPYTVRDENPWVPPDAIVTELERFSERPEERLCGALPEPRDLEILKGLYLGDVAAADRKVEMVLEQVAASQNGRPTIHVVTSDHGELFGERRLLGHEFNVREAALHVPLIVEGVGEVEGVSGAAPGVVDAPVSLLDIAPSLLAWTGLPPDPTLDGRVLPLFHGAGGDPSERSFFGAYSDDFVVAPEEWAGVLGFFSKDLPRRACGPEDKVFGAMASMLRYPFKLHWYERYPSELYDLSWDPEEQSEISAHRPEVVEALSEELSRFVAAAGLEGGDPDGRVTPREDEIEALRALGYID
jgi:arylsulfatase A-like enzyme